MEGTKSEWRKCNAIRKRNGLEPLDFSGWREWAYG